MPWYTFEPSWEPFRGMEQLRREMDRLWDQAYGSERHRRRAGVFPLLNLSEDQDHVYVRAELAGVRPEDIDITLEENKLVLRGERKIPAEEKVVGYHRREREAGSFRRVVGLPERLDPEKVEAVFKDGILTITLTKPEKLKPKQISVKTV
jgi:HSP20 family protein